MLYLHFLLGVPTKTLGIDGGGFWITSLNITGGFSDPDDFKWMCTSAFKASFPARFLGLVGQLTVEYRAMNRAVLNSISLFYFIFFFGCAEK
jgi:K+-transporting ATPase A subunit